MICKNNQQFQSDDAYQDCRLMDPDNKYLFNVSNETLDRVMCSKVACVVKIKLLFLWTDFIII